MPGLRSLARRVRGGWRALRFRLWVTRLRFELARRGARLALDAPHGAELERLPIVRVHPAGAGAGTLTLRIGQGVRFGRNVALELWAHGTNRLELGDYAHVYDGARLGLYSGSISLRASLEHSLQRDPEVSGRAPRGKRGVRKPRKRGAL